MLTYPESIWLPALAAEIERMPAAASAEHGAQHWRAVAATAVWLAERTVGADPQVARCFGLLHDCARRDDGDDTFHGPRAARLVQQLPSALLPLTADQRDRLQSACAAHSLGTRSKDPTIACCFDADRLQLVRLGRTIQPDYLSTPTATQADAAAFAAEVAAAPPAWTQVVSPAMGAPRS